jgi:Putative amidoligase enzyme
MALSSDSLPRYAAPPRERNASGDTRRVGLELEIGNLGLDATLAVVQSSLGGEIRARTPTQGAVERTPWGTFGVEFDSKPLKERRYLRPLERMGVEPGSAAAQAIEESLLRVASELVPIEIVTPAIPWNELQQLDPLWAALRAAGVEDTRDSFLYAFGLHLNPESPDLTVATVLDHLRAYLLLEPWLAEAIDVDLTRKIAPYIRQFPAAYRQIVLDPDYAPDWEVFVAHYVEHNPTRNRPLDLVPLIVHATGKDLSVAVKEWALVKPRPTYHYRLPNCEIHQRGWTPAIDWNRWVHVERLVASPDLLRSLCADYTDATDALLVEPRNWLAHVATRFELAEPVRPQAAP